jgi:hypothetical protein
MLGRSEKFKYKTISYKSDIPKPKKNEIIIIPRDNRLMEIKPYIQKQNLPSWWNELPVSKMSLRRCQGTYDFMSAGFIIPLWTDVTIRPDATGTRFEYKTMPLGDDFEFRIEHFEKASASGCPITSNNKVKNGQYPKLVSPWRYITPKGVSLISLPIIHEPNPNYTIMPGIVHTDFYNQIHVVINVLTDKEFTIPAGTPIQHMIPFYRPKNINKIVWGNDSMYRFIQGTGMGKGCLSVPDKATLYRSHQMENDRLAEEKKRWNFFKK